MTRIAPSLLLLAGVLYAPGLAAQGAGTVVVVPGGTGRPPVFGAPPDLVRPSLLRQELLLRQETPEAGSAAAEDARRVREQLHQLLDEHPPAVRGVFQMDPSLVNRPDYTAEYPRIAAFIEAHPEVARDPAFFFGQPFISSANLRSRTPEERAIDVLEGVLAGLAALTVVITVFVILGFLVRQALEHRRWLRQSRVQTEVHTKILDRLQSNEDLLSYVQTPAGQRFLQGAAPQDLETPPVAGAPIARILWSVQAGLVLTALGAGLWLVESSVTYELRPAFSVMSTVVMAVGVGAVLSAGASYVLSRRLGLIGPPGK